MFGKFLKKSKRIKFSVEGKPPKKSTGPSLWSENSNQTELVINLRQKAFEASQKEGFDTHFHGPVKLELTVYAPNILERKDRHDYLGDLDAFVSGVFESLQPAPKNNPELIIHSALKNMKNIGSDIPLIVSDDAQITMTITKKRTNPKNSYTVSIEVDNEVDSPYHA